MSAAANNNNSSSVSDIIPGDSNNILLISSNVSNASDEHYAKSSSKSVSVVLSSELMSSQLLNNSNNYDCILFHLTQTLPVPLLPNILNTLKPSARLILVTDTSAGSILDLQSSLILNGFTDVRSNNDHIITAKKPDWIQGASKPLSFGKKPIVTSSNSAGKVWSLGSSDLADNDIDLVDEDSLLAAEINKPIIQPNARDCGTGSAATKKACKNCSCGLAEELSQGSSSAAQNKPVSSCGSCGLGDAFRCASCPYLGTPAFANTSAVKLQL
jgi:hypothetical protein